MRDLKDLKLEEFVNLSFPYQANCGVPCRGANDNVIE